MADVFGRTNNQYGGSLPVDGARITFAGGSTALAGVGLLTQNLSFQYSQPITILFEIGTNYAYAVAGRARGGVNIARVLGVRPLIKEFYATYGDVCNMGSNILNLDVKSGSCGVSGAVSAADQISSIGIKHAVIANLGGSVSSENSLFSESLAMQFMAMTVS